MHISDARFAISVGPWCRSRFHLKRHLAKSVTPSGIFDWQGTPTATFTAYLERDFKGLFELVDIYIDEWGAVRTRVGAYHPHEFPEATLEGVQRGYANARSRHDYLAAKTRAVFSGSEPVLMVLSHRIDQSELEQMESAVKAYNPALPFLLLPAPTDDVTPTFGGDREWEGSHEAWDSHLHELATTAKANCQMEAPDRKTAG